MYFNDRLNFEGLVRKFYPIKWLTYFGILIRNSNRVGTSLIQSQDKGNKNHFSKVLEKIVSFTPSSMAVFALIKKKNNPFDSHMSTHTIKSNRSIQTGPIKKVIVTHWWDRCEDLNGPGSTSKIGAHWTAHVSPAAADGDDDNQDDRVLSGWNGNEPISGWLNGGTRDVRSAISRPILPPSSPCHSHIWTPFTICWRQAARGDLWSAIWVPHFMRHLSRSWRWYLLMAVSSNPSAPPIQTQFLAPIVDLRAQRTGFVLAIEPITFMRISC